MDKQPLFGESKHSILRGRQKRLEKRSMKDLTGKNERLKYTMR